MDPNCREARGGGGLQIPLRSWAQIVFGQQNIDSIQLSDNASIRLTIVSLIAALSRQLDGEIESAG
jgi:hypothetical protein